mgnify:FL=1
MVSGTTSSPTVVTGTPYDKSRPQQLVSIRHDGVPCIQRQCIRELCQKGCAREFDPRGRRDFFLTNISPEAMHHHRGIRANRAQPIKALAKKDLGTACSTVTIQNIGRTATMRYNNRASRRSASKKDSTGWRRRYVHDFKWGRKAVLKITSSVADGYANEVAHGSEPK